MKKKNLIIILVSILISLISVEVTLRFFGFNKLTIYYSSNYYGYYHEPNQKFLSRFNKLISLDNLGNRNPTNFNFNNSDLFFLGDSVTYGGSVVSNEETFAYLIANKLGKNYLNISANGWGIPNMINFIDFHNIYKKNSDYILTCIVDCFTRNLRKSEQNLFFKKKDTFALVSFFKLSLFKLNEKNYSASEDGYEQNKKFIKKDNETTIKYSIEQLVLLNEKLKDINSRLIFVYSPNSDYIKSVLSKKDIQGNKNRTQLLNQIQLNNIELIDISKHFDQKTMNNFGRFYTDAVHLSKEGHYLYYEIISKLLYD